MLLGLLLGKLEHFLLGGQGIKRQVVLGTVLGQSKQQQVCLKKTVLIKTFIISSV